MNNGSVGWWTDKLLAERWGESPERLNQSAARHSHYQLISVREYEE